VGGVMGFYTLRYLVELASLSLLGALPVQSGEAAEKQLRDVGEGDGVAALNALGGELLEEVAEEEIDGLGGLEVLDGAEKLGGEEFGIGSGSLRLV